MKNIRDLNVWAIAPMHDQHGNDASGAFQPEAAAFVRAAKAGSRYTQWPNGANEASERREKFLDALSDEKGTGQFDVIALFTHGLRVSLPQVGVSVTAGLGAFSAWASARLATDGLLILYSCSVAASPMAGAMSGEGSFCSELAERMTSGSWVWGHYAPGHTTCNPCAARFKVGAHRQPGERVSSMLSGKSWERFKSRLITEAHHPRAGDFRFRFPLMTPAEIADEMLRDD